jgi:hypothetical protein
MNGLSDEGLVFCTACGTVHDDATSLFKEQGEKIEDYRLDLEGKRRKIKVLEGDTRQRSQNHPKRPVALRVLTRWRDLCAPGVKELEGRRLDNCLARLKYFSEADLNLAVDGYSRFPFIVGKGRRSPFGTPKEWRADAELIFRDAEHVKQGMDLAQDQVAYVPHLLLEQVPYQRIKELNRGLVIAFLTECFGVAPTDLGSGVLESPCPRCDDGREVTCPLRIAPAHAELSYLARCSACDLNEIQLLQMAAARKAHCAAPEEAVQLEFLHV